MLRYAVIDEPTLQNFEADGTQFSAYWLGNDTRWMGGRALFESAAPGAEPVEAEPDFTG